MSLHDLPDNLFSLFSKLDKDGFKTFKGIPLEEDLKTKIILCMDKAVQQTSNNLNLQSLISTFGNTYVIMNSHFKHELTPLEFLTAAKYYDVMVQEMLENLNIKQNKNGSKTGIQ